MQEEKISRLDLFKPSWYIEQFKGWTKTSYILLFVGYVVITFSTLLSGINSQAIWTWVAAILGFTTTLAITNAKPMNGVFGLISALIYIVMALQAKNPADAMLQAFYIIMLDIPVLLMPSWAKNVEKKIRFIHETGIRGEKHGPSFWYGVSLAIGVVFFIAAYLFETQILKTPRPIADSFVLGTGMVGAFWTTMRFSESFIAWVVQGVAQVILWGLTAMHGDANWVLFLTYMLYVANDMIGVFQSHWFHHKEFTQEVANKAKANL